MERNVCKFYISASVIKSSLSLLILKLTRKTPIKVTMVPITIVSVSFSFNKKDAVIIATIGLIYAYKDATAVGNLFKE